MARCKMYLHLEDVVSFVTSVESPSIVRTLSPMPSHVCDREMHPASATRQNVNVEQGGTQ
jgi:hypothetical protein